MIHRIVSLIVLALAGWGADAHADSASCQARINSFRAGAVDVSKQAADVPGALAARGRLSMLEGLARDECTPLGFQATVPIEMTKEDLDLALGQRVPACKVFIDRAMPFVTTAHQARGDTEKAAAMVNSLNGIRAEAAEGCADYPGVMGRMYRAELVLMSFAPPPKAQRGKPD